MSNENEKKYYLYLNEHFLSHIETTLIQVDVIDIALGKIVKSEQYKFFSLVPDYQDFLYDFLDKLPTYVTKNTKGAVITIFEMNQPTHAAVINPIEKIQIAFDKLNIPCRFMTKDEFYTTGLLSAANRKPNMGETIIAVTCCPDKIRVFELFREPGQYRIVRKSNIRSVTSSDIINNAILGYRHPDQIIVGSISPNSRIDFFEKAVASKTFLKVDQLLSEYIPGITSSVIDGICETNNRFHLQPVCNNTYVIATADGRDIFTAKSSDHLPLWKDFELPNNSYDLLVRHPYKEGDVYNFLEKIEREPGKVKKINVTLIIQNNCIPILRNTKSVLPKISPLVKSLNSKANRRFPALIVSNNSTIIALWNKTERSFEAIRNWNNTETRPDYFAFDEKKLKIGKFAQDTLAFKPTTVIYDLLKIMSMSVSGVKVDPKWKFQITEGEENPVLIEFDDFEGNRKAASLHFLFALLLKHHVKTIENKTGIKVEEISIFLDCDKEVSDQIKPHISEASKKVNLICHVLIL